MASQTLNHRRQKNNRHRVEARLHKELERLKGRSGVGHDLRVVWSPNSGSKLSGEVKGDLVYIYEGDVDRAVKVLRHEFIDYLVSQAIEPYRSVTNKLIQLLNEVAYKKKEYVVEALIKLL